MIHTVAIFPATVRPPLDEDASLPDASVEGHTFAERLRQLSLRSQRRPCEHHAQKPLSDTASKGGEAIEVPPVSTPPSSLSEGQYNEPLEKQKGEEDVQDVLRMSYDESLEFHPETVRLEASRNFAEMTLRNHRLMRKILEREIER